MFLSLDKNHDGVLTFDELRQGIVEVVGELKANSEDWSGLIYTLDTDHDGKIDYSEFINAAINRNKMLCKENLDIAFAMFDADKNGQISIDELKSIFGGSASQISFEGSIDDEVIWKQIVAEVD